MKARLLVTLTLPDGVTEADALLCVREAARWWHLHPVLAGTPLARLDARTVSVRPAGPAKEAKAA